MKKGEKTSAKLKSIKDLKDTAKTGGDGRQNEEKVRERKSKETVTIPHNLDEH